VVRDAPEDGLPACAPPAKVAQVELINELSGIINSSLSIGTIFRMVVSELRKLIAYDRASLLLYNEADDALLIFALDTEMRTAMKKGVRAPIEGTSAGWVVRNNRPWISDDLERTQFPLDRSCCRKASAPPSASPSTMTGCSACSTSTAPSRGSTPTGTSTSC